MKVLTDLQLFLINNRVEKALRTFFLLCDQQFTEKLAVVWYRVVPGVLWQRVLVTQNAGFMASTSAATLKIKNSLNFPKEITKTMKKFTKLLF